MHLAKNLRLRDLPFQSKKKKERLTFGFGESELRGV